MHTISKQQTANSNQQSANSKQQTAYTPSPAPPYHLLRALLGWLTSTRGNGSTDQRLTMRYQAEHTSATLTVCKSARVRTDIPVSRCIKRTTSSIPQSPPTSSCSSTRYTNPTADTRKRDMGAYSIILGTRIGLKRRGGPVSSLRDKRVITMHCWHGLTRRVEPAMGLQDSVTPRWSKHPRVGVAKPRVVALFRRSGPDVLP